MILIPPRRGTSKWHFRPLLLSLALVLLLPISSHSQTARDEIWKEIAQLRKEAAALPSSEEAKGFKQDVPVALLSAERALSAGRIYLALYRFQQARSLLRGGQAMLGNPSILKGGLPAFEDEWRRASISLTKDEQRYRAGASAHIPAAVRAIAEASVAQARTYYESSRAYARVTSPQNGLFYLGQGKNAAAFAVFCRTLQFPASPSPPPFRSIAPELQHLQADVLASYQPPRSIRNHRAYIKINSDIKFAEDLDAAQLYFGALLKYLDALAEFSLLDAASPDPNRTTELHADAVRLRQRVSSEATDSSIAELFLERAESSLDEASDKNQDGHALRDAQVIFTKVVPAYFAALETPATLAALSGREITITLVRWPYT